MHWKIIARHSFEWFQFLFRFFFGKNAICLRNLNDWFVFRWMVDVRCSRSNYSALHNFIINSSIQSTFYVALCFHFSVFDWFLSCLPFYLINSSTLSLLVLIFVHFVMTALANAFFYSLTGQEIMSFRCENIKFQLHSFIRPC